MTGVSTALGTDLQLSIIIPTLNEAANIGFAVSHLRSKAQTPDQLEIIVVDCQSTDNTLQLAEGLEVKCYCPEPRLSSRAQAMNFGAKQAQGEVLVFLHADTEMPVHFDQLIVDVLQNKRCVGGAFEMSFKTKTFGLRIIQGLNWIRHRLWKEYFGDQSIFVRRDIFEEVSGFPDVQLMEDPMLCRALKKKGKITLIKTAVLTSPRRFLEGGVGRVFWKDAWIWLSDRFGRDVQKHSSEYRKNNLERAGK